MLRQLDKNLALMLVVAFFSIIGINAKRNDYKSQYGQDKFLNNFFFKDKKSGVFIDIGAHDGVSGSNTWFYEKILGWKGICFEPMPHVFKKLVNSRSCACVNACIAAKEGSVTFRQILGPSEMLSGIEANYDARHKARIEAALKARGGSYEFVEVPAYTLNSILEKNQMYHIDFLSLDIEGGELAVLKSIDFKRFYFSAITVENNYHIPEIRSFLESQNFRFVKRLGTIDEVYINNNEAH